jgi:hypothetical protein
MVAESGDRRSSREVVRGAAEEAAASAEEAEEAEGGGIVKVHAGLAGHPACGASHLLAVECSTNLDEVGCTECLFVLVASGLNQVNMASARLRALMSSDGRLVTG